MGPGRPRAIQGEVEQALLEALAAGLTIRLACELVGISHETYRAECERNPAFAAEAKRARLRHLPEALKRIRQVGLAEDWRAIKAWVELAFPDDFGRRLQVSGPEGGPLKVTADVSAEFAAEALRRLDQAEALSPVQSPEEPIHP